MTATPPRSRVQTQSADASVSEIELFFDLVFVFALTQVTDLLAEHPTWVNALRAVLVLAVLWWSWVGYSWLGNVVRADEGLVKVAMFAAMGASFIIALVIPEAFDDLPGGLSGPVVFALGYFAVRVIHLLMFLYVSRGDAQLRAQLLRWIPSIVLSTAILLLASQTDGTTQTLLWGAALVADYLGTVLAGTDWRLRSVGHFAERHGLIVIIALGESIVSIGVGVSHRPISWPIIVASLLGLAVSGLMWWAYFDITSRAAEQRVHQSEGREQIRRARNAYSFSHLLLVVGVIGLSLGLKKVLSYVSDEEHHELSDALHGVPLYALFGGVVIYLLGLIAFKFCATSELTRTRLVACVALLAAIPVANSLPALASLGLLTAVLLALVGYETVRAAEEREQIRHAH